MHLYVKRFRSNHEATISRVYLSKPYRELQFLCHGLEDEYRPEKLKHHTRIPAGEYRLTLREFGGFHERYSDLFKEIHQGMIWVRDVPGFTDILLHVGNSDEDTSGCLLLGLWRGDDNFIRDSRKTYARVYAELAPPIASGQLTHITFEDHDR